ncbi:hypothetical protein M8C21_020511 [Ambrosia artemisiifolia]|uniref:Phytocyanin domain-containing protein n=1 Tax=Ambrosia artemisiifolia TaxID=4212 RepID=A0AAD5GSR4_AMBAR|nr:hypothetical protein M8C21_020511 [Ambrosia artemisiifolia]
MANKNLCIFILVATIVAQATWVRSEEFIVGDEKGWDLGIDYTCWLSGKEFHFNDALVFKFKPGKHNVAALPDQASLDSCALDKAIFSLRACGRNTIYLAEGENYLTSSIGDDCKKGLKLIVTAKGPRPEGSEN